MMCGQEQGASGNLDGTRSLSLYFRGLPKTTLIDQTERDIWLEPNRYLFCLFRSWRQTPVFRCLRTVDPLGMDGLGLLTSEPRRDRPRLRRSWLCVPETCSYSGG